MGAFAAGVLSFLSPCVFPLIPAYLAQLTGMSLDELQGAQGQGRRRILIQNALAFVIGLAVVFTGNLITLSNWITQTFGAGFTL